MSLAQPEFLDDAGNGLRVTSVQVAGYFIVAVANHMFHLGLIGGRTILEHPISQVELAQGQRRAGLVAVVRLPSFGGHPISADLVSVGEDVHCESTA